MRRKRAAEPVRIEDDGSPLTWRFSRTVRFLGVLWIVIFVGSGIALLVSVPLSWGWWAFLEAVAIGIVFGYLMIIRPRIDIDATELRITTWYGVRVVALAEVTEASAGYYGLTMSRSDGSTVSSSVGQKTNVSKWLGKVTKGDRWAAIIVHRSQLARGEDPGPIEIVGKRGVGNPWMGIFMLLGAILTGGD